MPFSNSILSNCKNQITLFNIYRKLWADHVFWIRAYIISTASDLDDIELVTQRLLRNPTDFALAFRNFYGMEKAKFLESLMKNHLLIAADLINDLKAGNMEEAYENRKKWQQNANKLITFLGQVNPQLQIRQFASLFNTHLKMTEEEALYRLNGKYDSDISTFDSIEAQALEMADLMAYGILNQFYYKPTGNARK